MSCRSFLVTLRVIPNTAPPDDEDVVFLIIILFMDAEAVELASRR